MEIDGIVWATRNQPRSFPRQSTMRHNPQVEPCPKSTAAPEKLTSLLRVIDSVPARSRKPNIWTNVSVLAFKKRQTTYSLKRSRDSGYPNHLPFCDGCTAKNQVLSWNAQLLFELLSKPWYPSHSHDAHWLASGWLPRSSWIEIDAFTSSKPNRPAKPLIASWMPGTDVLDFQVWQNSNNNNNNNATGWENHQFENTCPLEGAKVSATPTQSAGPRVQTSTVPPCPTMKVHYITGLPTRWISLGISFSMRVLFTLFLLGDLPAFSPEFPVTPEILGEAHVAHWPMC